MIKIKTATFADTALLSEMGYETFSDTYAAFNTKEDMDICLSLSFNLEKMGAEILNDKNIFLIAYEEAIPAGYALLKHNHTEALAANHPLEIARFYARTSFIGKGVGKALMQYAIDYAISIHTDYLWLSVWQRNPRAIDFYTKFGFSIHAKTTYLLGNDLQDDWLMKKELSSM
jgi:diamine N-acetyltransferase